MLAGRQLALQRSSRTLSTARVKTLRLPHGTSRSCAIAGVHLARWLRWRCLVAVGPGVGAAARHSGQARAASSTVRCCERCGRKKSLWLGMTSAGLQTPDTRSDDRLQTSQRPGARHASCNDPDTLLVGVQSNKHLMRSPTGHRHDCKRISPSRRRLTGPHVREARQATPDSCPT